MITLFVAIYSLLCLCTAVNTSNIKELHVRTVTLGENVTMECNADGAENKNNLVWYRQSFGKMPQFLAKAYSSALGYSFDPGFNAVRFSVAVNDDKFDLCINELKEDDAGEYFCGELEGNMIRFTSGTRLEFQDEQLRFHRTARKPNTTDAVTLQCLNNSRVEGLSCTENMHMFFCFSILRVGLLFIMDFILTMFYMVSKSRS